MRLLRVAVAIVLGFATVVQAEPLDLKQVSADAKWVAHVDVDAIRASTVAQKAYQQCLEKHKDAEKHLAKVREKLGMDPTKDLHGVTFYGKQLKKHTGVVIVQANADRKHLLAKVKEAPDYRAVTYGSHKLHTWTHRKGKKDEHAVVGCFHKPTVIVFGRTAVDVSEALDVLDGKSSGLAGSNSPLIAEIPAGAIFLAGATGLDGDELPCKSPLVKQSEALSIALGEHGGESFAMAKLATKSDEVADQVKAVVEGVRAMAALRHGSDADAMKIVKALKVAVADKAVTVELRVSADEVWTHLQKVRKRMADKDWKKHWRKHHESHK